MASDESARIRAEGQSGLGVLSQSQPLFFLPFFYTLVLSTIFTVFLSTHLSHLSPPPAAPYGALSLLVEAAHVTRHRPTAPSRGTPPLRTGPKGALRNISYTFGAGENQGEDEKYFGRDEIHAHYGAVRGEDWGGGGFIKNPTDENDHTPYHPPLHPPNNSLWSNSKPYESEHSWIPLWGLTFPPFAITSSASLGVPRAAAGP